MHITECLKTKYALEPPLLLSMILSLLLDPNQQIRIATLKLAQAIVDLNQDRELMEIFTSTLKPKSARKAHDKKPTTPLKTKKIQAFLG